MRIARLRLASRRRMVMSSISRRVIPVALITLIAALTAASASNAEVSDDCSSWTFLPDFRCEERTARPEGAFNPVGMPYLFEDPHITTNLNFAYIYNQLPAGTAFQGGSVHVLALQIRLALTDKLAFIATKDGLAMLRPGPGAAVASDTGIYDMTFGFKYALIDLPEKDFILTPAVRYEVPLGSERQFQGYGSGVFIPSASFRWGLRKLGLERANLVGSIGGQIATDRNRNVDSVFYNLHLDYGIEVKKSFIEYLVPFIEVNGMNYTSSGAGTNPIHLSNGTTVTVTQAQDAAAGSFRFEGFDVANLGSTGVAGANSVVVGGGVRMPTTWGLDFAVMYEGPVTSPRPVIDQGRFTFMAQWEM
jgi:hypothetical protein